MHKFDVGFLILIIFGTLSLKGQNPVDYYFPYDSSDLSRWAAYDAFLKNDTISNLTKADSCYSFALAEYDLEQYEKTRDLCEAIIQYAPDWPEPHILIGKAYLNGSKNCTSTKPDEATFIFGAQLWVAFDEWEKATQKGDPAGLAKKLINTYSTYLPERSYFRSCFSESTAKEDDDYFVSCWIQRSTKIRFKKN
jgi:hypothetical protein